MSLYGFKSSRCSPCNQSTQRRRKTYCCWVSSSPIKRAEHERVNTMSATTVELTIKVKIKFTPSNAEKTQWIHLTTDVGHLLTDVIFSHQLQRCLLMGTVPKRVHLESCQVCGQLWFSSALANCLRGLEDYVLHLCVVKSVHLALQMTCLHLWLCVA